METRGYKPAFTLTEILVTLAIASVLIAILLPCLVNAREHAKILVCASNLKQNYMVLSAYANAYNGYWPRTDCSSHTNGFYKINSTSANSPLYYLWLDGFVTHPETWYCPSGRDSLEDNWQKGDDGKWQPKKVSAVCGYQYRMFFAYNWPDIKTTAIKKRQSPEYIGYIKPSLHRNLAVWVDTFSGSKENIKFNHQIVKSSNVLFNDSSVRKRRDDTAVMKKLDLSWCQAGDWRIPLANGSCDTLHSLAFLWYFFDNENWQFNNKTPF